MISIREAMPLAGAATPQDDNATNLTNGGGATNHTINEHLKTVVGQRLKTAAESHCAAHSSEEKELLRAKPAAAPVTYWASQWWLLRQLFTLHDAAMLLAQIGARL